MAESVGEILHVISSIIMWFSSFSDCLQTRKKLNFAFQTIEHICLHYFKKILCFFNRKLFYFGLRANQDKCLNQENYSIHDICPVTRKPVFGVCNQVRLKPACAATCSNAEINRLCWLVC